MIYISSPFTHESKSIEKARYEHVQSYTAHLIQEKQLPYSPIVFCYPMHLSYNLPGDAEYWRYFNIGMMKAASEMHVLKMNGWDSSRGVSFEIDWWEREHKKGPDAIHYIEGYSPWLETTKTG